MPDLEDVVLRRGERHPGQLELFDEEDECAVPNNAALCWGSRTLFVTSNWLKLAPEFDDNIAHRKYTDTSMAGE